MSSKDFFGGVIVGASIGIATGILLAPAKGNDTLRKISDVLKDRFTQFKGEAEDVAHQVERKGKRMLNEGNDVAQDLMEDGEDKINELKNKYNTSNS